MVASIIITCIILMAVVEFQLFMLVPTNVPFFAVHRRTSEAKCFDSFMNYLDDDICHKFEEEGVIDDYDDDIDNNLENYFLKTTMASPLEEDGDQEVFFPGSVFFILFIVILFIFVYYKRELLLRQRPGSRNNDIGNFFTCPISHQLPLDPVMAEDGIIYERSAIQDYIRRNQQQGTMGVVLLKSPVTREIMGRNLFPTPQIKSLIECHIDNNMITGDLAEDWKDRRRRSQQQYRWW